MARIKAIQTQTCSACSSTIRKGTYCEFEAGRWTCSKCAAEPAPEPKAPKLPPARVTYGNAYTLVEFDRPIDALTAALAVGEGVGDTAEVDSSLARHNRGQWMNYQSKEELREKMLFGCKESAAIVAEMLDEIGQDIAPPKSTRRKIRRNVDNGTELDLDRVTARRTDCWERIERHEAPARVARIGINASVHGGQRPEELAYRAAAAIALADRLQAQGVSVEILLCKSSTNSPTDKERTIATTCPIKLAHEPLDIGTAAAAAVNIGVYRVAMYLGTLRYARGKTREGLGTPDRLPESLVAGLDYLVEKDITTRSAAIAWLNAQIEKFDRQNAA